MTVDELAAKRAAMDGLGELMAAAMAEPDPVADWLIEEPGVYPDIPDHIYLRDPVVGGSLSSHGARLLLPPSCPAMFQWRRTHPRPPKAAFDFGHAAHQLVLGVGPEIVEVKADDWRSKSAQQQRDEARAAGKAPLLTEAVERVRALAEAIRTHPVAGLFFVPGEGMAEQTLAWPDVDTGVFRRGRLDWLPEERNGRLVVPDLKTAACADSRKFARQAADFGYAMQAAWYLDGLQATGVHDDPEFVFVVVEQDPPHLINIIELDQPSIEAGRRRNRAALDIYARCTETGEWSGYSDDVELVSLPQWYLMHDPTNGEL